MAGGKGAACEMSYSNVTLGFWFWGFLLCFCAEGDWHTCVRTHGLLLLDRKQTPKPVGAAVSCK